MVDVSEALESQFLNGEVVRNSKSRVVTVVDPGKYEDTEFGRRITLGVNIDGKSKLWRPNKEVLAQLKASFGGDTVDWLGKPFRVDVKIFRGKETVCLANVIGAVVAP